MGRLFLIILIVTAALPCLVHAQPDDSDGPLDQWPDFTPIGFITAPHPDNPATQTHLYGDWGAIVGEEFIFLQDGMVKLLYHSYHETYLTEHPLEQDLLSDWALGYDPVTKIKHTPLAQPGGPIPGPAWSHTDTPGYLQHPITGDHLLYNTVRPGTAYLRPEWDGIPGSESAIQVATSASPPAIGEPFDQTFVNALVAEFWWEKGWINDGIIKGGLSESTPVWVPHLGEHGKVRLFYRGLHGAPGSYWNWRISYADSEDGIRNWVKNETPTFDPSDPSNPAYQWTQPPPVGTNFRGSWQAHCTGDVRADGVHMVMTVSNQNFARGGFLAYYWSPDWGDTWYGHPDNPIIIPGDSDDGVPSAGFQRTPTLAIDEEHDRYILAYNAGDDAAVHHQRKTYLAVADRPVAISTQVGEDESSTLQLRIESIAPNPGPGQVGIRFMLAEPGRLRARVYGVDGRLVARVVDEHLDAGSHAMIWDKRDPMGSSVPSGIYLLRADLEVGGRRVAQAEGRILVVK